MRVGTRFSVFSVTSSTFRFLSLPRFCCWALQIEKMLLMAFIICPISFEFLFFLFISFSKSCSKAEFFSEI